MRERKSFIERTRVNKSDQVKKKYFFVFEGSETEEIYFDAVNGHREELQIDPLIELVPLVRDFGEDGWSNPKKIVDRLVENVAEAESGEMTYDILFNRIMDYLLATNMIKGKPQSRLFWNTLLWICENKLSKKTSDIVTDADSEIETILKVLVEITSLENIAENIGEIIKKLSITFDSEIDKICLVVDRDKNSFVVNEKINQYKYVVDVCKENGFGFYITNPCFEFWLLLHFDDFTELDKALLFDNPNITKKKTYAEKELSKRIAFKKNRYDADSLVLKLQTAIVNVKTFCEDIDHLENEVGSNLGKLFEEIIDGNK